MTTIARCNAGIEAHGPGTETERERESDQQNYLALHQTKLSGDGNWYGQYRRWMMMDDDGLLIGHFVKNKRGFNLF